MYLRGCGIKYVGCVITPGKKVKNTESYISKIIHGILEIALLNSAMNEKPGALKFQRYILKNYG